MRAPGWKLDDDRKTVTLTFDTEPRVSLKLVVEAVEEILTNLENSGAA